MSKVTARVEDDRLYLEIGEHAVSASVETFLTEDNMLNIFSILLENVAGVTRAEMALAVMEAASKEEARLQKDV